MPNCRHLANVSVSRLSSLSPSLTRPCSSSSNHLSAQCAACPPPFPFHCLNCGERFCSPSHFKRHSRQRNHPIALEQDDTETERLYCGNCDGKPEVKAAKDRKLMAAILEEIHRCRIEQAASNNNTDTDTDIISRGRSSRGRNGQDTLKTRSDLTSGAGGEPKGLSNLGNTCFMNATLQALNASVPDSFLSSSTSASASASSHSRTLASLRSTLQSLRSTQQQPKSKPVVPRDLLNCVSQRYKKFSFLQQQDAHEFLRCLFNCIKDEQPLPLSQSKTQQDALHVFCGKMLSRVRCGRCRKVSDTEEPFLDLCLSLNHTGSSSNNSGSNSNSSNSSRKCSLEDSMESLSLHSTGSDNNDDILSIERLLTAWSQPIELKGANGYHCESCSPSDSSVLQDASLVYKLASLPEVLIIQLQRFKTVFSAVSASGKSRKRASTAGGGFVMDVQKDYRVIKYPARLSIPSQTLLAADDSAAAKNEYELTAFIEHDGASTTSGHYTAVVRHSSAATTWYHCSDTRVKPLGESSALDYNRNQPYLLFYRRCQ